MKTTGLIIAGCVASASAFAPSPTVARVNTELSAWGQKKVEKKVVEEKPKSKSLFKTIAEMDLFAPNKTQNDYGARDKKNVKVATLGGNSYVPDGLTREQYDKQRKAEAKKKSENYQRNVKKAGVFEDYTQFYIDRGTDTKEEWKKDINLGHRMAKTKYNWSGDDDKPVFGKLSMKGKKGKK
jgi:hypothetical protein